MPNIVRIVLPVYIDKAFDYIVPKEMNVIQGVRVKVPFGNKNLIGIVVATNVISELALTKLKPIISILDNEPIWPTDLFSLLKWASHYYKYPLGLTLVNFLPTSLKKGELASLKLPTVLELTELGVNVDINSLKRAPKQQELLSLLQQGFQLESNLLASGISQRVIAELTKKELIIKKKIEEKKNWYQLDKSLIIEQKPILNNEQEDAVKVINAKNNFNCFLLNGVTGSGKTEVYLNVIEKQLLEKKQALVLIPEIGLTPQIVSRFQKRFNVPIGVIHSGLTPKEKLTVWLKAKANKIAIVLGTRSALFIPFLNLGVIIVDEEHDSSYKQQEGLKYNARDLAIMRARDWQINCILGSATPSFESLANVEKGKYLQLNLHKRAGNASQVQAKIIDIKAAVIKSGLSSQLKQTMQAHLEKGNQVLLFLNRRGFAPSMLCHECGWVATCSRCELPYTLHKDKNQLSCHHCGSIRNINHQCPKCGSTQIITIGLGTEQLEEQLRDVFPDYGCVRIDRDSTRKKGSLETLLTGVLDQKYQIIIGTQMLAKGHHFPKVTLVALLDVDGALFSSDFRAAEHLAQLYVQVSGRAGRDKIQGEVLLQTHHPEHPLLLQLLNSGYNSFTKTALEERKFLSLPPYSAMTIIKAVGFEEGKLEQLLQGISDILKNKKINNEEVQILGPMPSPLAKIAGKHRWHLILQTSNRAVMQTLLFNIETRIRELPLSGKIKWSIDVDPLDLI